MNMNLENMENLFLSSFVAEVGGSLGGTLSATQALMNGALQDPELRRDLLGGMDRELHHLRFLFENWTLAEMIRTRELNLIQQTVNLPDWLSIYLTTWQKIAPEKNLQWIIQFAEDLPEIDVDLDFFARVLENLVYASILCSPPFAKIMVTAKRENDFVKISIFDAGPRINPLILLDNLPEITRKSFENHPRLKKGLGIGIIVANQIVHALHGELEFSETKGFNSCISIVLPIETSNFPIAHFFEHHEIHT